MLELLTLVFESVTVVLYNKGVGASVDILLCKKVRLASGIN